ncbi:MAG: prolipoprotein diacylglyceryl transferase [Elusimicrobia bacterium]|jgi:phosphatidylglycerol:prolipoprotein diacylglycerol transferase|nr:prolipoprotein diacylglyceryl transferase [Elusimicrobiota bacterium]
MHPILFKIGSLTIYSYGVLVASGLLLGLKLASSGAKYRNISKDFIGNLVIGTVISGFIGARLFYVLLTFSRFYSDPVSIIRFWEGGLVFSGGLLGGAFWVIYSGIKYGVNIWSLGDILAPGLALGHGIGRIGCFFAGCCYGKPTSSVFGISFHDPHSLAFPLGVKLIPTQLISALYMALAAYLLYRYLKSSKSPVSGVLSFYFILYGSFRIVIEYLRGDFRGTEFAGWTLTQWVAAAAVIFGAYMIISKRQGESKKT